MSEYANVRIIIGLYIIIIGLSIIIIGLYVRIHVGQCQNRSMSEYGIALELGQDHRC